LKRLAPNCINAVFHACWSSPPQRPQPPQTDERKGAASREVGEFYLQRANYHAAESRFREALAYNPADIRAMFDLGESLEKLDQPDKAIQEYRSCVQLGPDGAFVERCRKGLDQISSRASATRQP
jgi:Tfp pilus assembly protein PilF